MYCLPECHPCLENLARRCASLATADAQKHDLALKEALGYLEDNFSLNCVSTGLAAEMQRLIRQKTGNSDPFAALKKKEIALARRIAEKFALPGQATLHELVQFAAKGNGFDFFQDLQMLEKQFQEPVEFARDETAALGELLSGYHAEDGNVIVYLADNAGECLFDLPLVKHLGQWAKVYYAVKGSPVQNDLSLIDLEQSGLIDNFPNVISTGTDSPGLDLDGASPPFKNLLARAALIIAKGMGHYETLPELSLPQPVFLIFQVKCNPIAEHSGLPRHSYAAYFLD
ncbi:MAG: DUF89 family protein [Firmicutes bacterium]|nr:DUF89 family protein [Bacillota bacterium]